MSGSVSGWLVSVGIPVACMGAAYLATSGRKLLDKLPCAGVKKSGSGSAASDSNESPSPAPNAANKRKQDKKLRRKSRREASVATGRPVPGSFAAPSSDEAEPPSSSDSSSELAGSESDLVHLARLRRIAGESASPRSSSSTSRLGGTSTLVASSSSVHMQPIEVQLGGEQNGADWSKIDRHEDALVALKTKAAQLTEQLEAAHRESNEQRRQLEAANRRVVSLEGDLRDRTKTFAAQLDEADQSLQRARRELEGSQEQLAKVVVVSEELRELNAKCTAMQELIERSERDAEAVTETNVALVKERALLQSEVAALHRQLEEARKEAADKIKAFSETSHALAQLKAEHSELELQADAQEKAAESAQAELKLGAVRAAALEADVRGLELERAELTRDLRTAEAALSGSKQVPSTFVAYLENLANSYHGFQAEKAALLSQIVDLKRKMASQ